jgi:putative transposase
LSLILNWRIEERVSSEIRVETIREALKNHKDESLPVTLITDGGPENDNNLMKRLVSDEVGCFKTFIALRDVPFSNSIIEAQNKVFKYRYLFRQNYETLDELKTVFGNDVKDFNFSRPHISLKGYTPYEVHSGQKGQENEWKNNIENARRARIAENRKQLCEICK